jgi:sigma-B regulation protein RsbU (phosphoserine phosphatase)
MTDRLETNMVNQSRPTIGLLVHRITDQHGSALWNGIMTAARAVDANVICFQGNNLGTTDGFLVQGNTIYQLASADNVDGLVFSSATLATYIDVDEMRRFADQYRPLPQVSVGLSLKGIPSLTVENYGGMREVVAHLIEAHGFRRIAFISGPAGNPEGHLRYQAYADALADHGLSVDPALVSPPTEWVEVSGREALRVLIDERGLQPGVGFEAVAASNDETALGVLAELQARGIHVPEDVAVTGFDDFENSRFCTPPLTTVSQPVAEQARLAVELILAQLRGEEAPQQKNLPTQLIIRESCGCPNSMVMDAAVGSFALPQQGAAAGEALWSVIAKHKAQIQAEMIKAAGTTLNGLDPEWMGKLITAFSDDVAGESENAFRLGLDMAIRQTARMNGELRTWQNILSVHRGQILPFLSEKEHLRRAEDLWQQARVAIAEAVFRYRAYREARADERALILQAIGQELITTFDLENSVDALANGLPRLGLPGCYLALYDFPEKPKTWSNLIFAFNEKGRADIPRGGLRFPSLSLIPENLLPNQRAFSLVVKPLYFRDQSLGFVIFETGPQDGTIYESLRGQISSMLKGVLLVQEVQQHTALMDTIVTETLATSEEMLATISETSRQAQAVASAAQQSVDVTKTGESAVANTVAGMETIQRQVKDIAQSILALSERTQQIGEIISAVEDIADQSRLLALNASIEAARAGDEGRGFAVVAREMRHLSGQSREATTKVSDILNEIQRAANTAVMVTEEGSKGAQEGMKLADSAGDSIRNLAAIIEEAARIAIQIAASTHQQTNAMDQLVVAMKSIKAASTQTSASIKDAGL